MAGLFAAASFTALGQVPADAPRPEKGAAELPPEPAQPDASKHDVYINDSFEATDALAKGRAFAGRGRWRDAAELLQQASDSMGDKLVRASGGFVSVRSRIAEVICAWPEEGREVYRSIYDRELDTAVSALGGARTVDDLLPLFERYFCTSGGAKAADLIGQLAIESGDLPLADYVYRRAADHHPDARTSAARYKAILALLTAIRGEPTEAALQESGDVRIRWKGQERALRDIIADVDPGFSSLRGERDPNDWAVFGGDAERNRETTTRIDEPGLLWRYQPVEKPPDDQRSGIVEALVGSGRDEARSLTMFPVVGDGFVYVQRYRDIAAVRRNSGAAAWQFSFGDRTADPMGYFEDRLPGWDSPAFDQGRLFAALPAGDGTYYNYDTGRDAYELICLDAATGRTIWRVAQKGADAQGTATAYDSGPIVRYGRVYIVSRRRRSFGFEDSYLDCYRASDGKLLYRTHLGSASTSAFGLRGATKAIVAVHGDSVYVCTNLGSIAAVSAYTGAVRWLQLYERYRPDAARASSWSARELNPWYFNPVIWSRGRIVVLPTDSSRLLVLSADDGRLQRAIPVEEIGDVQSVFGVHGDLLCGAGGAVVCYDLAEGGLKWSARLPEGAAMFGRGVWAGDELLVPRRDGLSRFRVEDGVRKDDPWGGEGKGGNLLALPDQLFVAGADELACYARKSEIWKNLRERMAAAPDDASPALEFAEVALGAGEVAEALSVLDEAVRRVTPSLSAGQPSVRDRVLADVLKFVDLLSKRSQPDGAAVDKLYGYACESARDPASNISYRFRFAELFAESGQPERAVRLYQQVLRDRSLREMPAGPQGPAMPRAGARAQARIGELIERHGPGVYAAFETEAAQWLEAARTAGDEDKLRGTVEAFPNSNAASAALAAFGELLSRSKRYEEAARQFARAYNRYGERVDRPALLRKIADAYESGGQAEHAYLWLTKAIREFPTALIDDKGRKVSFAQYRDRLGDVRAKVEPSRAKVVLPLGRTYEHDPVGHVQLLVPTFADDPSSRWADFYVYSSDGIRAYDAATGKERWSEPAAVRMNAELLIARADVVVFATSFEVFGLDAASGRRRWTVGEYPARLADPGADWEDGAAFRTHGLYGDRLVSVRDDGSMSCVAVNTGDLLWSGSRRPAPLGRLRVSDSLVAYYIVQDGTAVLCMLDAATGEWLDAIATDERHPIEDVFVTLDRQIVVVTSQSIASYDAETQTRRWQASLNWPLRQASLVVDMDAAYFIDEGSDLHKLALEDGRTLWESERVIVRGEDDVTVQREGGYLLVSTATSVCGVDSATGLVLWQGTTPERARFVSRLLSSAYVVALNVPGDLREGANTAYFYDYRNASGVIPRSGGTIDLGKVGDVRASLAADGAIIIQSGTTIRGYARE
jgi:outer membrane protein assembly factor BamB